MELRSKRRLFMVMMENCKSDAVEDEGSKTDNENEGYDSAMES